MSSIFNMNMKGISVKCLMLFVLFAIATEPLMRYLTKLAAKVETRLVQQEK